MHFRFNPEYKAQRGRHGEGSNCKGREGEDVLLKVPVGTIVYDAETGEKVHDLSLIHIYRRRCPRPGDGWN